jgi:hypothetical protein
MEKINAMQKGRTTLAPAGPGRAATDRRNEANQPDLGRSDRHRVKIWRHRTRRRHWQLALYILISLVIFGVLICCQRYWL